MDESDGSESVVADSEESDRTPSPSILGGLELLDRKTVTTDVGDASSDDRHYSVTTSEQSETASGINEVISCENADDEQKRDISSRTASGVERSCSPEAAYPFFEMVKNYYHSPVFTPPRKLFKPASSNLGDKIKTDVSHGPSTVEISVGAGATDGCSQVLFSGSQDSSMSQSLSVRHRECVKSTQEDQNKDQGEALPNSTSFDSMFGQSRLCELGEPTEKGKNSDIPGAAQLAPSDPGTTYKPSMGRKVKEGSHSDEQPLSSHVVESYSIAVDRTHIVGDNDQVEKDDPNDGAPPSDRCFLQESGCMESASKLSSQPCDKNERPISHSPGTSSSASIDVDTISKSTTSEETQSSHLTCDPDKTWNSSKQDDSKSLNSLEEEYKTLSAIVDKDEKSLAALKEKLKKLQQAMKDEAQKIQQQRGHIMNCYNEKMSGSQQQQRKQELLNLSRKQKHLLYILNIHKGVATNLSSKEMKFCDMDVTKSQRATLPSNTSNDEVPPNSRSQKTSGMHVQVPSVVKTKELRAIENSTPPVVMTDGTEQDKDETQDIDSEPTSQLSQSTAVQTPMPQLNVKDLIENGLIEPSKGCMSFLFKGRHKFGDLQQDGSILSEGVLYKTEKEWFKSKCGQPASIRKPKLWNLIKYDRKPLKVFADQCQLLSIAKKIEVPKAAMKTTVLTKKNIEAERQSSFNPTAKISSFTGGKKLQSRGVFDPTVIKSVVLIGDNEFFSEDELLMNGFWENRGSEGSLIPLQWLKEINLWED